MLCYEQTQFESVVWDVMSGVLGSSPWLVTPLWEVCFQKLCNSFQNAEEEGLGGSAVEFMTRAEFNEGWETTAIATGAFQVSNGGSMYRFGI